MSPRHVHFNGSINMADAESVMREIVARVPTGLRRIPDGEPGERAGWIFYQAHRWSGSSRGDVAGPGLRRRLPEVL